jgi:thioredoxin 1
MTPGRASRLRRLAFTVALLGLLALAGCGSSPGNAVSPSASAADRSPDTAAEVTFIELGSDKCIPCKQMRPVMDAIARAFGDQVDIVFYDVWKDDAPAREYGIQYIPTQVFLDENGVEFHRHIGFYPQEKIEALLVERGLKKTATP